MAGFVWSQLAFVQVNWALAPAVNIIAAVPVGHKYLVKKGSVYCIRGGAGAASFYLELSDSAGANWKRVTDLFTSPAAAGNTVVNLTPNNGAVQNAGSLLADPTNAATGSQFSSLDNLVMEAGQILRVQKPALAAGGSTLDFVIAGLDYTA